VSERTTLSVNDVPIKLDYFVEGYLFHVVSGIMASLHDTGEVNELTLNLDNDGQVEIRLNGSPVELKYFPIEIIRSTLLGIVAPLKGVEGAPVERLELTINT
jgi:hypothetical protein